MRFTEHLLCVRNRVEVVNRAADGGVCWARVYVAISLHHDPERQ